MEKQTIETNEMPKQKNMPLFILKIVGNVIFYLIIVLLLLFSIMNIRAGNRNDGFPNIFGKGFLSVQTNSMEGEKDDSFSPGDLLIVSVFNENKFDGLEVGQIVTFYDASVNGGKGGLNSHRIVYIHRDGDGRIDSLAVQGDRSAKDYGWVYNPADQSDAAAKANQSLISSGNVQNLTAKDIKGVMTGIWRGAGTVMDNLQKYWLFIFVLPVLLFLIFEIFMVIRNVMLLRNEKHKADADSATMIDLETQKEELRAQILAELRAEQEKQNLSDHLDGTPTEEIKDPVVEEPAVEEPVVEELAVEEPVAEELAVEEAVAEEPAVEEPVAEEPVAEEPAVEEAVAEEPVAEEPAVEEAVAEEPVAEEAVVEEAVVEEAVVEEPAVEEPQKKTTRKAPVKKTTSSATKKTSTSGSKTSTKKSTTSKSTGSKSTTSGSKASTSKTGAKKTSTTTRKKTNTGAAKEKGE